jgi:hypothetical protein
MAAGADGTKTIEQPARRARKSRKGKRRGEMKGLRISFPSIVFGRRRMAERRPESERKEEQEKAEC